MLRERSSDTGASVRVTLFWSGLLALSPLLAAQAVRVWRSTPRLPEARGSTRGTIDGRQPAIRVAFVGESTVAGVGADHHAGAISGQTAAQLNLITGRCVHWRALGRNGTTAATCEAFLRTVIDMQPDVVVVALGVNDTTRLTRLRRWRRDVAFIVEQIRRETGSLVMLCAVPPMHYFDALPQPLRTFAGLRADLLDARLRELCTRNDGVRHVPVEFDFDRSLLAADGYHPSERGYAIWGRQLGRSIAAVIGR